MRPPRLVPLAATSVASLVLVACAAAGAPAPSGTDEAAALAGDLTVFAAASLTDVFAELAAQLEDAHPDLTVTTNLAGSSTLATQLVEGAPADLFAAADEAQVAVVVDEGLARDPVVFATNALAIAVEPGNPLGIQRLEDLARDDVVLILAAPEVPAGRYAAEVLDAADVEVTPASLELDVRAALGKVTLGEADAAIVYVSDVASAGDAVEGVTIPDARNVVSTYPIVTLDEAPNPEAARAFVDLLLGAEGAAALEAAGFRPAAG